MVERERRGGGGDALIGIQERGVSLSGGLSVSLLVFRSTSSKRKEGNHAKWESERGVQSGGGGGGGFSSSEPVPRALLTGSCFCRARERER